VTPVFDSAEIGTTWDKLLADVCVPPDTAIEIESRAGDEQSGVMQVLAPWSPQPAPYLRPGGPELPFLRREAARATRRDAGVGTWELLLQNAHGRFLQLRGRLRSNNGISTPRLRALRVWAPRFAYTQRFLPAVYREDGQQAVFLERWLANFESTLTHIEDKVANVEALFDARTVPTGALDWLAEWFELALDPAWDERRNRLFVKHAMDFSGGAARCTGCGWCWSWRSIRVSIPRCSRAHARRMMAAADSHRRDLPDPASRHVSGG